MNLPWLWWWFNISRHLGWHDHTNLGVACLVPVSCALCCTLNQPSYFSFEQVVHGYIHWRYVIIFVFFFRTILKRFWSLWTLPKHWKTKGLKLLCNIKTCWISMLNLLKCLLWEYKSLIVKMHMDAPKNKLAT
jgi:hypothetical protein